MRLTTSGIVFLIAGVTLCIAAYRFALPGLLPAGILLIMLVGLSLALAFFTGARLAASLEARTRRVERVPVTEVGQALEIRTTVTNRSPLPVGPFELILEPQDGFGDTAVAHVPGMTAGAEVSVDAEFLPRHRGMSGLRSVRTVVAGPFGLTGVTKTAHSEYSVAVSTPIQPVRAPRSAGAARPLSDSPQLVRGDTSRDFHTREYVPGDDLRHIHWASTARVGELMVRQEAEEETPFVAVILDTGVREFSGPATELLISGAASVASSYLRAGYDLLFYTSGRRTILSGKRGEDMLRLASARYEPGSPAMPDELARLGAVVEAVICAQTSARADQVSSQLPRKTPRRRLVAEEVPEAAGLGSELFGESPALPDTWTRSARRSR
ncbi:hypothetical protein GCM10022261_27950 [Brevibacterium daeguense]|uniref:DUF58 domain-containing protein n=1 Tax=Brevibacterium daeguense TaxID=909936 RepID=A0ABP8EMM8_9MICO|nr:DUF58 domain-containing protein [Brevibacterium daeguense]